MVRANDQSKIACENEFRKNLYPSENGEAMRKFLEGHDRGAAPAVQELSTSSRSLNWFAAYTAPRHEKRIAEHFQQRQIDSFLPLYRSKHKWSDGSKAIVDLPLFPGYIFVHVALSNRVPVLEVPGVLWLVSCGRCPAPLPDAEVEALREGLRVCKAEPHPYLVIGERVRIKAGPFTGMEGGVLRKNNIFRVVLTLSHIMHSMAVEIDACDVEQVNPANAQSHCA